LKKTILMTPGPSQVPPESLLKEAEPVIHHRTPEFSKLFQEVNENLKHVFRTNNEIFIIASSGTGALEAAVSNTLKKGDKALVVVGGKFGERWRDLCKTYGLETIEINVEWGKRVDLERIREKINDVNVVFTTLVETSTGVLTDIKAIAGLTRNTERLLVVDAVSGLGGEDLRPDEWGIDVVVAGSQKALMVAPGLSFVCVNEKAIKRMEESNLPKFYFDLKKYKKSKEKGETPFTPSVSLIKSLNESLKMIKAEGIENVLERHKKLARATREAVKAINLELFSESPSNTVTPVDAPEGIDAEELVKIMEQKHGIKITGGQEHLKGKIFRLGHMGYITKNDIIQMITALELTLSELRHNFELGNGVKKAIQVFKEEDI